jgi:hypothetical protein
MRERLGEE